MDVPAPELRRVKITTDVLSSNAPKLQHLAASHPFTRQIDVVFPSSDVLESALSKLETRYWKGQVKLSDVVDQTGAFANFFVTPERCFTMLSIDPNTDDVWCIDPRGLLTLSVSKETYETLGLLGTKLPFKKQQDQFVIRLPLQKNVETTGNRARRNEALKAWDARRERQGSGPWTVLYCAHGPSLPQPDFGFTQIRDVHCQMSRMVDIYIPSPSLSRHPSTSKPQRKASAAKDDDDDVLEDWNTDMAVLFEWVGMASLGAQRLKANDRVDPYVSVYECPSPSHVGSMTHLRWTGFLGSDFVQSVVDMGLASVKTLPTTPTSTSQTPFIAITSHAFSSSPVSYIPSSSSNSNSGTDGPLRLPRADGEDTWCLLASPGSAESQTLDWSIVESLGQYDTRWG
ncbi:Ribonuclease P protein subunit p40 [Hypsizygus marmoreus]|uniref:Ribonuclease P protein subunit p40 n=1 Tax=Hypsizygus marmoreus TaxID=39966 RepID=A0A369JMJ7_HYPMA|nr:Ribonuclease P protein subunit p40 [Hypsizygus marmoreus]